jgi:hypothetical protein
LPVLKSYDRDPGKEFWDLFPKNKLPNSPQTKINIEVLEFKLYSCRSSLTECEFVRGKRLIEDLRQGATSEQIRDIPGCSVPNSDSTIVFGRETTDAVASWLSKGFAAGPFETPPFKNFRSNCLIALRQGEKVRIVVDLSAPKNHSFNDNIDVVKLEKVRMSSVKQFAKTVAEAGYDSKISKLDLVDAYKNVPCGLSELRIQGFCWLEKFFVETQQIFGAKSAVPNFDRLGNTILALALSKSGIQKSYVHRTLDDVPVVAPAHTSWGEDFVHNYLSICKDIGVDVTSSCPKNEKAFVNSYYGKVLGVFFDTQKFAWRMPESKVRKTLVLIEKVLSTPGVNLKEFQQLVGRINFVGQLSRFMQGFKFNINRTLGSLQREEVAEVSEETKQDLRVWANFLLDEDDWHTLSTPHYSPPLSAVYYTSDAAGCSENRSRQDFIGCGNVGVDFEDKMIFASQLFWPPGVLQEARDKSGKLYGQKTTTLEFLGILVPFLKTPDEMAGKYVVVRVDNISCFYGWINRQAPGDESASVLIRTLHLLCYALDCEVHIEHLPRMSTWEAELVDRLSRVSSTTSDDKELLKKYERGIFPQALLQWMKNPIEDWGLPERIVDEVLKLM